MLACTLGCDELFERGYIGVDAGKIVASSADSGWTESVHEIVKPMLGGTVAPYQPAQEEFFRWHRQAHGM